MLGRFAEGVHGIKDCAARHTELVSKYEGTPPRFPVSVGYVKELGVGMRSAARMQNLVRKAQRDFRFSMIYEQRKTNEILVAGFEHLAEALEGMEWEISASIDALTGSVRTAGTTLSETAKMIDSRLTDLSARASEALEMLDNIQRRRRP
jgi:hypothetical protein